MTVGEFAFWNNPADPMGGRPGKEGGGPLSKLLSGGDTSTNSISHPIRVLVGLGGQVGDILHGPDAPQSLILTGQLGDTQWVVS